ncbi:hypothetical protein G6F56_003440 [Rhizopus delemar]|nr:hypothetical protein G6F56_003440 [Rhizopus delemar]
MTAPNAVKIHLAASLHKILSVDFPDQWPGFMQELEKCLMSDQIRGIHVGLIGLHELVKVFQWKSAENREPLYNIVAIVFPVIQTICLKLFELEAADMLKLALKIYHSSIQMDLPPCFEDQMTHLVPWCSLFIKIIEKPINVPNDTEDFEKYVWWGTKKWAYRCLNLLVEKYSAQPDSSFMKNFTPNILTTYLQQLDVWMKKECYMSDKCLALSANFLCEAVKHKITWKIMKGHVDTLVSQFIFPLVCFSSKDELIWTENPVDYVHKKSELFEESNVPQQNVTLLLVDLIRSRKNQTFMTTLNFVNSVLGRESAENGRDKDGALYMIGALAPYILESKSISPMMEPFFGNHVLPEFKSKFPFLRARACELVRYFNDLEFSNEQNLSHIYLQVLDCLRDEELPVQVQAALALQHMIRNESGAYYYTIHLIYIYPSSLVKEATVPHFSFVIQTIISLMNQVDMDMLVTALEEFVETFSEQLPPFSVELCKQLSDTYLHLLEEINAQQQPEKNGNLLAVNEEIFNSKIVTAMSVIETIQQLISDPRNSPDMLSQIELVIIPIIQRTTKNKVYALYNEIFEMIAFCILALQQVSQPMWSIFELCYKAFKEDDEGLQYYATQMVPSFYNFITLGKDVFVENEQVKHMIFDIIDVCMGNEDLNENDRTPSCRLIESVLLNCSGQMDNYVPSFLNLAFRYILGGNIESIDFKVHCLEIVINCIYYNPRLTLGFLEENNWTQGFFSLWFSTLSSFSSVHDKKLIIVALCALLKLPVAQIPTCLQPTWPQILVGLSDVFKDLSESIEGDSDSELADDEDEDDEEEEEEEEIENRDLVIEEDIDGDYDVENDSGSDDDLSEREGDEDVEDEDAEYLEYLAQEATANETDVIEERDTAHTDENLYQSPLDCLNLYEHFEQSLKELQHYNAEFYDYLMKNLSEEDQNNVVGILSVAEKSRIEN